MTDIWFIKFGNNVTPLVTHYVANVGFRKVYSISINFQSFGSVLFWLLCTSGGRNRDQCLDSGTYYSYHYYNL
jgi:hypothetical protein